MVWDVLCEAPISVTNPNNQETTHDYDELCRLERTDLPLGIYTQMAYMNLGDPNAQFTQVEGLPANGTGTQWAKTYFDGLGRSYKSIRRGEQSDIISNELTFNARGLAETTGLPRFSGDPLYTTTPGL